ncbi:amidohydrolase family protein [Brevibacterium sp. 50QC2O2]|jgi:predicted amidohydrolase YtcJ|uniref:amidohydrolase n=1 Tax=Brevibacterium sp. 50QC2O2 TaxID=2968459 RepID=UPI00211D0122|nr:amidohydrolase family protein [Brevibacterium sp. 50QC2O2]MCQ9388525.1 amidohydrolase family protein [Brevibacterium sp. 50QC2O2]
MTDPAFDYSAYGPGAGPDSGTDAAVPSAPAVQVFANARVFTGEGFSAPQDVIVDHGRVAGFAPAGQGARDAAAAATAGAELAQTIDVGGAHLLPGFTESHGHPVGWGLNKLTLDLRPGSVGSIADVLALVAEAVAARAAGTGAGDDGAGAGKWIVGTGWDETYFAEARMPTRADLDSVAPDVPVYIERTCGHMAVVNSAALAASGIDDDTADPDGGKLVRDPAGHLTGLVQEDAKGLLALPADTVADMEHGFALAQQDFNAWGVTTVNDCLANPDTMRLYQRFHDAGRLSVRMRPWLYAIPLSGNVGMMDAAIGAGVQSGFGDDMLRIQGVKFQLDGSLGGKTAATCTPYEHTHDTGILTHPTSRLTEAFGRAARGGLRMAIHAIGDAAIGQALEALEASGELDWVKANRVRIEHCSLPTDAQLDTMVDWGLIASSSISFVYHLGDSYPEAIGQDRLNRLLPHRTYIDRGIVAPGNSDLPVTNGNPWEGIYGAVTRTTRSGRVLDEAQNITLAEALAMYTSNAAYGNFEEDRAGAVAPGRFADFQILQDNPFDLAPEAWLDLAPSHVFLGGRQVL